MKRRPPPDIAEELAKAAGSGTVIKETYSRLAICHLAARDDLDSVAPEPILGPLAPYDYNQFKILTGAWSMATHTEHEVSPRALGQARWLRDTIRAYGWGVRWGQRTATITLHNLLNSVMTMFGVATRGWPRPCDIRMLVSFTNPEILRRTRLTDVCMSQDVAIETARMNALLASGVAESIVRVNADGLVEEAVRFMEEHYKLEHTVSERLALAGGFSYALDLAAKESNIQ